MDLRSKLKSIYKPSLKKYVPSHSKTTIDFYNNFVNPKLPNDITIRAMHKELMEYVDPKMLRNSVFSIRIFGSDKPVYRSSMALRLN